MSVSPLRFRWFVQPRLFARRAHPRHDRSWKSGSRTEQAGAMRNARSARLLVCALVGGVLCLAAGRFAEAGDDSPKSPIIQDDSGRFEPLTEPLCNYCSTQHRKGLIRPDDRALAWLRSRHNGGAFPIRHFLAGTRVINDTYGLFFYDPDGGYVAAYEKDYGYRFHGRRRGVMVVRGEDGTLWSALTGRALEGPQAGKRLQRVPSLVTTWEHWLMLHPESTTYDLLDGETYKPVPLPEEITQLTKQSLENVDDRLQPLADVLAVEVGEKSRVYPLGGLPERACLSDTLGDEPLAVFWYAPAKTAVAYSRKLDGRTLTLYADSISPDTAPFKDKETGTRWTLAGRGVDGPLRGRELKWIDSIQCRWYAWAAENPETEVYESKP